jgi:hypothetical protein
MQDNSTPSQGKSIPGELSRLRKRLLAVEEQLKFLRTTHEQADRGAQMLLARQYRELAKSGEILSFPEVTWESCMNPAYDVEHRERVMRILLQERWEDV